MLLISGVIQKPAVSWDWVSKAYMIRCMLFMGINKCRFPQSIGGLQNSVPVRNQSKMPPRSAVTKSNINKISRLLIKMRVSLPDSWHKWQTWVLHLSIPFWRKFLGYEDKCWLDSPLLTAEQKRTRVQMTKQLLKKYPKYQKKVFDNLISGDETSVHFYDNK